MAGIGMQFVLLALSAVKLSNGLGLSLYDCNSNYDNGMWKTLWDANWKAWCCEHASRGCPPTSTITITSTSATTSTGTTSTATTATTTTTSQTSTATETITTTTTNLGCWNTNCSTGGASISCAARIKTLHGDITIWNKANQFNPGDEHRDFICHSAVRIVKSKCAGCAEVCDAESYCEDGKNLPCQDYFCSYGGMGETCGNRFANALRTHRDVKASSKTPCSSAYEHVTSQCPQCSGCSETWWCSQQGGLAPPPASQPTATRMAPTPAAVPHKSQHLQHSKCDPLCQEGGVSASCADRIKWAMTNNPQITLSSHPCLAAGELVQSQCPACGECSPKWFCAQPGQKQSLENMMFKFASRAADGLPARTGFIKLSSVVPILACIVTGIAFASLLRNRRAAARGSVGSVRMVMEDQSFDEYADPLCPVQDAQAP